MLSFWPLKASTSPQVSDIVVHHLQNITREFTAAYQALALPSSSPISLPQEINVIFNMPTENYNKSNVTDYANIIDGVLEGRLDEIDEYHLNVIRQMVRELRNDSKFSSSAQKKLQTLFYHFLNKYTALSENPKVKAELQTLNCFLTEYTVTFTLSELKKLHDAMSAIQEAAKHHVATEKLDRITSKYKAILETPTLETLANRLPDTKNRTAAPPPLTSIQKSQFETSFETTNLSDTHRILEKTNHGALTHLYFEYLLNTKPPVHLGDKKRIITFVIKHIDALSYQEEFNYRAYNRLIFEACSNISALEDNHGAFIKEKYAQLLKTPLEPAYFKLCLLKPFDVWFQENAPTEQKPYTINQKGTFLFYPAGTIANDKPLDEQANWRPKPKASIL
ncbi:MAG: hypothetical protein V4496_06320 [Pseudomonadota bacterium]